LTQLSARSSRLSARSVPDPFPRVQDLAVCVVLPAYHAGKTLEATLQRLPEGCCRDIILVDDASTDDTVAVARRLGIAVHARRIGGTAATRRPATGWRSIPAPTSS